jgi:hypothetical protein
MRLHKGYITLPVKTQIKEVILDRKLIVLGVLLRCFQLQGKNNLSPLEKFILMLFFI